MRACSSFVMLITACAGGTTVPAETGADTAADTAADTGLAALDPDLDGDGTVRVLVLGSSRALDGSSEAPEALASELEALLEGFSDLSLDTEVVAEDLYDQALVTTGYGQAGQEYDWAYHRHSLAQYYYWPDGRDARWSRLAGGETPWDHVLLVGDPRITSAYPGFHALGVNRIAEKVTEGGAAPLLLMAWDADPSIAQRVADNAIVPLEVIPVAEAWSSLDATERESASPTALTAATLFAHLTGRSASESAHTTDPSLAEAGLTAVRDERERAPFGGLFEASSPFARCDISDRILTYNHTGTSSERGILRGLQWVLDRARVRLIPEGEPPLHFNYGRANTEFEAHKRYQVDPERFQFSLGFPMQDHSNHGDTSMLYGLDKRRDAFENGTDLGVAQKMMRDGELPTARALPVRALFARMHELIPEQSAYADGWHMNADLDKATGAFMYTLLTGHCAVDAEPTDTNSPEWRSWMAHKIGYETAWSTMHLSGRAPCLRVLPDSIDSTTVSSAEPATLTVSFQSRPRSTVSVRLEVSDDSASVSPTELVFSPDDHTTPRTITLEHSGTAAQTILLTATTQSDDPAFDGVVDRWTYGVR